MQKRLVNYDIVRALAIILVIYIHCIETVYIPPTSSYSIVSQVFKTMSMFIGRFSVPLFLFLTGALVLKKNFENANDIKKFYHHNLLPLYISFVASNIIYYIFIVVFREQSFNIISLLKYIFFIERVDMINMWYMPMIIGIYIAIPFISIILKKFTLKEIKLAIIVIFIYRFFIWSINPLITFFGFKSLETVIDLNFLGSCHGLYLILGYYISNKNLFEKIKSKYLIFILFLTSILATIYQIFISNELETTDFVVWYDSLFVLISSICLFLLILRLKMKNQKIIDISKYLSIYAYALFIIHIMVIEICNNLLLTVNLNNSIKTLIIFLVSFPISYIFVILTSKIKVIKKYLYLIKD